jgi:hypothetical protein
MGDYETSQTDSFCSAVRFLYAKKGPSPWSALSIRELKPYFMGIGVNFNAAVR